MDAERILYEIGDKYNLNWDYESMLTIACRYIDNQCSEDIDNQCSEDAFIDFVEEMARSELPDDIVDE